jgi:hypothetical protein
MQFASKKEFYASKRVLSLSKLIFLEVNCMGIQLKVDGKEISLNAFVERFIEGTVVGGVSSLKGINDKWKKIEIEITKQG